jgi:hypothetical protein
MDRVREEIRASKQRRNDLRDAKWTGPADTALDCSDECHIVNDNDPQSFKDAMAKPDSDEWISSYQDEMNSLKAHSVWMLIPWEQVPTNRKIIPLKPVFNSKKDQMVSL